MGHSIMRASVWALAWAIVAGACGDDDDDQRSDHGSEQPAADAGRSRNDGGPVVGHDAGPVDSGSGAAHAMTFFVSSDRSMTGDLGGLAGADARCQRLAQAVGRGGVTWHAYLSAEHASGGDSAPVNARDRIGTGPWYNVEGVLLASDVASLHALPSGDPELFLDEHGDEIPGQWAGSPAPVEHDILTGSDAQGMLLAGKTCADWTSDSADLTAQVGHSDGLGPSMNPAPPYNSWSSSHENGGCNDTAPRGGAGRIYCFAVD
jgi:hypothetical protein